MILADFVEPPLDPWGEECDAEPGVEEARYGRQPLYLGRLSPDGLAVLPIEAKLCLIVDPEAERMDDSSAAQFVVYEVEGSSDEERDCIRG